MDLKQGDRIILSGAGGVADQRATVLYQFSGHHWVVQPDLGSREWVVDSRKGVRKVGQRDPHKVPVWAAPALSLRPRRKS